MSLKIENILFLISQKFPITLPSDPTVSREERKLAGHFINLIEQAVNDELDVEEEEIVINENSDGDWVPEKFDPYDDVILTSHLDLKFGTKIVSRQEAQKAIDFYRSTASGSKSFKILANRFRWIKTHHHLEKLRKFEKDKDDFKETRTNLLQLLSKRLFEIVKEKLDSGHHVHDCDIQVMARRLNRAEMKVEKFVASKHWITDWKKSHRIVSRKITKFVTRRCLKDKEVILKSAEDFVQKSRQEIANFLPSSVLNADQTGVQKELYGARALAFLGEKDVTRLVQSKSSLTHSFTFLPTLYMDGSLGQKAYMVLSEPTGCFPPTRPIPDCPNLVVRAGKSHIMTKELMKDWLRTCVFLPSSPKEIYMLIDSWPSFRDHIAINECVPAGFDVTIRNIPAHTTSLIQPLDVYWNGPWKSLLKKFTSYTLNFHPEFLIAQRNNEIWMVSLLYHQISARLFKDFLQYSWRKAGYMDKIDVDFKTPANYCFGPIINEDCYINGCLEMPFIRCARCENYICFEHYIVTQKHLCPFL
ncbi:unnamed protein product [Caenorhabditis nigoni]